MLIVRVCVCTKHVPVSHDRRRSSVTLDKLKCIGEKLKALRLLLLCMLESFFSLSKILSSDNIKKMQKYISREKLGQKSVQS